ncbi:MAG: hypothetical protein H6738_10380 [Alphaproteobacteria bacterium]|nr:hypothetical protein [Alphaproteobacteria bacterium]MCB9697175.1 hypothetical protein [Alphaproteobacteria bacterium]
MEVLESRVRATAVQSALMALGCAAIGLGLLGGGLVTTVTGALGRGAVLALFGVGSLAIGWVMGADARSSWPVRRSELVRVFESEPHRVWWVYGKVGRNSAVVVCLDDGAPRTLSASRDQVAAISELARQRSPGVLLGWGDEQQRLYRVRLRAARG